MLGRSGVHGRGGWSGDGVVVEMRLIAPTGFVVACTMLISYMGSSVQPWEVGKIAEPS
jgi:hypothetical protein